MNYFETILDLMANMRSSSIQILYLVILLSCMHACIFLFSKMYFLWKDVALCVCRAPCPRHWTARTARTHGGGTWSTLLRTPHTGTCASSSACKWVASHVVMSQQLVVSLRSCFKSRFKFRTSKFCFFFPPLLYSRLSFVVYYAIQY